MPMYIVLRKVAETGEVSKDWAPVLVTETETIEEATRRAYTAGGSITGLYRAAEWLEENEAEVKEGEPEVELIKNRPA